MAMNELIAVLEKEKDWIGMNDLIQKTGLKYFTVAVQGMKLHKRNLVSKQYIGTKVYYKIKNGN